MIRLRSAEIVTKQMAAHSRYYQHFAFLNLSVQTDPPQNFLCEQVVAGACGRTFGLFPSSASPSNGTVSICLHTSLLMGPNVAVGSSSRNARSGSIAFSVLLLVLRRQCIHMAQNAKGKKRSEKSYSLFSAKEPMLPSKETQDV